jgi:sugar lactone lactonase YvrE
MYIADRNNHRIRRIDLATGVVTTVAGTGERGFAGDGGPATQAQLAEPFRVLIDQNGDLVFTDRANQRVRKITRSTGMITTVAGDGSSGGDPTRSFAYPAGLAIAADGSVYVADGCFIRRLIPGSITMEVVAGVAGCDYSVFGNVHAMTVDRSGGLLLADSANGRIRRLDLATKTVTTVVGEFGPTFGGDGGPANLAALNGPMNISRDLRGQMFIGDRYNSRLRRIDAASGIIKTLATGLDPLGTAVAAAGVLYATDGNGNKVWAIDVQTGAQRVVAGTGEPGFSGDGGQATLARLNYPYDVAVDAEGNLFISDHGNERVRRVDTKTGVITTVLGNGECGSNGDGGPAVNATVCRPMGLHFDRTGRFYVADSVSSRVRRIDTDGRISTVAGNGSSESSGDGGLASAATLNSPHSIVTDNSGNVFIMEADGHRVRRIDIATGLISTIAGTGVRGFSGDGGLAIAATFDLILAAMRDPAGNLYLVDHHNNRVRVVHCATNPDPGVASDCDASRPAAAGDRVQVTWRVTGATQCVASGAWQGSRSINGGESVVLGFGTRKFALTCTGPDGTATREVEFEGAPLTTLSSVVGPTPTSSILPPSLRRLTLQGGSGITTAGGVNGTAGAQVSSSDASTSASTTTDSQVGSAYRLMTRPGSLGTPREWWLEYLNSGSSLLGREDLTATSDVLWRSRNGAVALPSGGWLRVCESSVFTLQDGYQLLAGGRSRTLQNGWQSEIVVKGGAEAVLVTGASCSGESLVVSGYAFGVSADEPPLRDEAVPATSFKIKLDPMGRESARKGETRPISVGEICALPRAQELEGFCRTAEAALRN